MYIKNRISCQTPECIGFFILDSQNEKNHFKCQICSNITSNNFNIKEKGSIITEKKQITELNDDDALEVNKIFHY